MYFIKVTRGSRPPTAHMPAELGDDPQYAPDTKIRHLVRSQSKPASGTQNQTTVYIEQDISKQSSFCKTISKTQHRQHENIKVCHCDKSLHFAFHWRLSLTNLERHSENNLRYPEIDEQEV